MKKIFRFITPVAIAAIALASCQKEAENQTPEELGTVHITVKATPDALQGGTRTYIANIDGINTIIWGTGEYMRIAVEAGENTTFGTSTDASADMFDGESEAMFEFDITSGEAESYSYMGLYPASAAVESNNTNAANYKVNLISTQNATASSYDPAAYIMVAKPEDFPSVQDVWEASYRRATALNKVTLTGLTEDIKKVRITAPAGVYLAGARHINLTTGESGDIYNGGGRTETIEVKYATPLAVGADMDIWFTSWDATIPVDAKLTIVAYSATHTFTREITVVNKPILFKEGYLNTLSINMANATQGDNTELESGNYLILAKKDNNTYYALKAEKEEGKERLLSVDYSGSLSSYAGSADLVWSVTKSDDSYTVKNDGKYLGYKGSSNESYWLVAGENWTESNYLLDITAQDGGVYHVTVHSNSNRYLSRNTSSSFFAFYGNTNQYANILFVPATVDERNELTLSFENSEVNLTTANYNGFEGQTATPSVAGKTITYSWDADESFGLIDENDGTVELAGIAGSATVTASFAGDNDYLPATASYTITVSEVITVGWVLAETVDDVTNGQYVITWDNTYYLPNTLADSNPAVGSGITVSNKALSNEVTDDMIWTFYRSYTDGFVVYAGDNLKYLNSADKAQGISVTGTCKTEWTVSKDDTYGMLMKGSDTGSRYLAVYNSASWRYYALGNDYKGKLRLYKYVDSRDDAPISWNTSVGRATITSSGVYEEIIPTLSNDHSLQVSYASSNPTVATINSNGQLTFLSEGNTTVSATYDGSNSSAPYKTTTVSYNLIVTDSRDQVATPTFDTEEGEVEAGTEVSISCTTSGATIYYTTDGSDPTTDSDVYTSAIEINETMTIKAMAVKDGYKNSIIASAEYTVVGDQPDVPAVGTLLWGETWTGATTATSASDDATPSANYGHGTTVYNEGTVSYSQSANSVYIRNENLAKGDAPELMLTGNQKWTIQNIATYGATKLSLTYKSNNTKSAAHCPITGATIRGASTSYTIILPEGTDFITIYIDATGNSRIDNVELKVAE